MTAIITNTIARIPSNIRMFCVLQVLDFVTTMIFLQLGEQEANPMIVWMMSLGPIIGVGLAKLMVLVIGGVVLKNPIAILIANVAYIGIVGWNTLTIIILCL